MGKSNIVPNGILLYGEEKFVAKVLEENRWSQVEDRTIELLRCIQPNHKSEALRHNVVSYLKILITSHVPCQVFEFGSVPLKTYLPDGDIDLTVFGLNEILPEYFIHEILQILENEKKNEFAPFRVKDVQLVQAEVKIIKCLIENFAVDISFNQLSGLCALCFFEEVNFLIRRNHLFKRSIILIKAWCYHESRLLSSNRGLFSTYGLEILVLYIFHLYNNEFAGPLEVLFRFLEFFSKFDWENYCISLSGPVPKSSLPDMIAESPRKDCEGQDLLLTQWFLSACKFCYGNRPGSQENREKRFVPKYINIVDPLWENNNLGRSINKGSFLRIKNAISFGAQRIVRLLNCTDEYLIAEFDYFFKSTWDRHGNGFWIPVQIYNLYVRNRKFGKSTCQESEDQQAQSSHKSQEIYQKLDNQFKELKLVFGTYDACAVSQSQSSRTDGMLECDIKHTNSMENVFADKGKRPQCSPTEVHDMHYLAADYSSAEAVPICSEAPTQHFNASASDRESGLIHSSSSSSDNNMGSKSSSEVLDNQNIKSSSESQQYFGQTSCDLRNKDAVESKNASNIGLHMEDRDCLIISERSRTPKLSGYLQALMGHSVKKEEHRALNMTESSKSGYQEAVICADSNNTISHSDNEAMKQQEEEHQFVSTTESYRNPTINGYLEALLLGVKKSEKNSPPLPPSPPQNMPYSLDAVQFPELQRFPSVKRALNVGKGSVDPPAVIITDSNAMNPAASCQTTPALDSTLETSCPSSPPKPTQPDVVHDPSTVSTDILGHENTTDESDALNVHALHSPCASGSSPPKPTQPDVVHDPSTVSTDILGHENTTDESDALNVHALHSPCASGSSHPKPTQPDVVHDPSTVSTDIIGHESTTAESDALNVHDLHSPGASGSSLTDFPFTHNNLPPENKTTRMKEESSVRLNSTLQDIYSHTSHVNSISQVETYLLNQCSLLNVDYERHWTNLQYGRYCQNKQLEEHLFYPPIAPQPNHFQAPNYWNWRPSGSGDAVTAVVPIMPPTLASDSHEGTKPSVSIWLPRFSKGTGTFMPHPLAYQEYYESLNSRERASTSDQFQWQPKKLNSNSRKRFSRHNQNHSKRSEKPEGKEEENVEEESHQGEGSSSAVNNLANLEHDSKNNSPNQP